MYIPKRLITILPLFCFTVLPGCIKPDAYQTEIKNDSMSGDVVDSVKLIQENKNLEVNQIGTDKDIVSINEVFIKDLKLHNNLLIDEYIKKDIYTKLVDSFRHETDLKVDYIDKYKKTNNLVNAANSKNDSTKPYIQMLLNDYKERVGSNLGATSPAKVSFKIGLFRAADNKLIWESNYFFQDQSASENLFKIGNKLSTSKSSGWIKASELLISGLKDSAKSFNNTRHSLIFNKTNNAATSRKP